MTKLPQKVQKELAKESVKTIEYVKIIDDNLVLVTTDKGTYCYTNDVLYRKNGGRKSAWMKLDDKTLHRNIF